MISDSKIVLMEYPRRVSGGSVSLRSGVTSQRGLYCELRSQYIEEAGVLTHKATYLVRLKEPRYSTVISPRMQCLAA